MKGRREKFLFKGNFAKYERNKAFIASLIYFRYQDWITKFLNTSISNRYGIINVALKSLFLTLNMIYLFFWCFHCWLQTNKYWQSISLKLSCKAQQFYLPQIIYSLNLKYLNETSTLGLVTDKNFIAVF